VKNSNEIDSEINYSQSHPSNTPIAFATIMTPSSRTKFSNTNTDICHPMPTTKNSRSVWDKFTPFPKHLSMNLWGTINFRQNITGRRVCWRVINFWRDTVRRSINDEEKSIFREWRSSSWPKGNSNSREQINLRILPEEGRRWECQLFYRLSNPKRQEHRQTSSDMQVWLFYLSVLFGNYW
jgi:hypothetical protein